MGLLTQHQIQMSYKYAATNEPLLSSTVGQLLEKTASECGSKLALVLYEDNIRKTYEELNKDVDDFAAGLLALGLKQGDRVGIWGPNSYEWVLTQYATAKIGMIMTTINPAYQSSELEYCLNKLECSAIVTAETFKTQDYYKILCQTSPDLEQGNRDKLSLKRLPYLKYIIIVGKNSKQGTFSFEEVVKEAKIEHYQQAKDIATQVQFDDPVSVLFTSGTTGKPKGATLSHFNIVNNAYYIGKSYKYDIKPPIICEQAPLYHCYGCIAGILASMVFRGTCVIPSAGFNSKSTLKAIETERCDISYGTPTMYIDMMNQPDFDTYDLSSLEIGTLAGAVCLPEVVKTVKDRFKMKDVLTPYGCTEASPLMTTTHTSDNETRKLLSVGKPIGLTEIKLVDDNGRLVAVNQPGEICVRGHNVFLGYWEELEKTKEVLKKDKWLYTGDLGTMDEEGYIYIIGRKKDMVIRGGENIYPREIEEFLSQHPDVNDAHVIGVPDKRMGEELCAWVKLNEGKTISENDLKQHCKGKISHFKIPKYIIFTDNFPKTVSGKVQKFILKEWAFEHLNLTE